MSASRLRSTTHGPPLQLIAGAAKSSFQATDVPVRTQDLSGINRDAIRQILCQYGLPSDVREDLEQDVIETFLRSGAAIRAASASHWLSVVCRNMVADYRKRERLRLSIGREVASKLLSHFAEPEDRLQAADEWSSICRALLQLPPTPRRVVFLWKLLGKSPAEVARALGTTEAAARKAGHRGMTAFARGARTLP